MRKLLGLVIVFLLGYALHAHLQQKKEREAVRVVQGSPASEPEDLLPEKDEPSFSESRDSRYTCDGRKRCSQMHSCEEATWFIENCPGMEMDGDNDGVPCESHHCEHQP